MAKQGLNFQMPISVEGLDISTVEKIEFKFKQREVVRTVLYPSDDVVYDFETGEFKVIWMREETYRFHPNREIELDVRITLNGSIYNPETYNTTFTMNSTLYEEGEE